MAFIRASQGGGGGLSETEIWTNYAPYDRFSEDTVTCNQSITNFTYLKVQFFISTSNTTVFESIHPVDYLGDGETASTPIWLFGNINTGGSTRFRIVKKVSNTSLKITDVKALAGGTSASDTIPIKIFGLR